MVEGEPGQNWEEVNHGPGRAADDRTVGIRATIGHRAVRIQTFAVEVGGEYGVLQPIVSELVVRVEDGRKVADGVLATVGGRYDLRVYLIGLAESLMNVRRGGSVGYVPSLAGR